MRLLEGLCECVHLLDSRTVGGDLLIEGLGPAKEPLPIQVLPITLLMVGPEAYLQLKELIVILSTVAPVDHSGKIPNFR